MVKAFPYLEVSGTHKEVGGAIGERFKDNIGRRVNWQRGAIPNYENLLDEQGPYYNAAKDCFPELVEELEAIASAAGVPLPDLFFVNNRDLFDPSEDLLPPEKRDADRCTIAVSFNKEGAIIGHNEDWTSPVDDFPLDDMYILKATIGETTILGLEYATELPGDVANMNNWGLVQCINELMTDGQVGVPKNFIARAVLECKTLDEAEKIIVGTNRASGFNHVVVQDHEVRNFETAGLAMAIQRIKGAPFVHTNHYVAPEMSVFEEFHTPSSEARYKRAKELVKNDMGEEEMVALLSDRSNGEYPICRHGVNFKNGKTVSGLVFNPAKKEVFISYDHPCAGEFTRYRI